VLALHFDETSAQAGDATVRGARSLRCADLRIATNAGASIVAIERVEFEQNQPVPFVLGGLLLPDHDREVITSDRRALSWRGTGARTRLRCRRDLHSQKADASRAGS